MEKMKDDFYSKWEKQRKKKLLYVFLHGSIYLGLPIGTLIYLLKNNFMIENLDFSDYIEKIVFSAIVGFVIVLLYFNRQDKIFLDNNFDIIEGIKRLKTGMNWKYENLIITNVNNETLVVKNKLFWFDKSEDLSEKSKECYNTIFSDYEQLKKDKEFDEFSKKYKVRIQIYDVLNSEKPLIDQAI